MCAITCILYVWQRARTLFVRVCYILCQHFFLFYFLSLLFCQAMAFSCQTIKTYGKQCELKLLKNRILHKKQYSALFGLCNCKMSLGF